MYPEDLLNQIYILEIPLKTPVRKMDLEVAGGYLRASLFSQMVKNLPAMQKTRVQSLDWEDPVEKGMATHSGI